MQIDLLIGQLQTFAINSDESGHLKEAAGQVADELIALQSIFGEENITLLPIQNGHGPSSDLSYPWHPKESIRLCITVSLNLRDDNEAELSTIRLSATLPSGYPQTSKPPQLQLLSRYIGPHGVDHSLFGHILRTFHQTDEATNHVIFQPGEVCLFEGIERVREKIDVWYSERETEKLQRRQESQSHNKIEQETSKPILDEHNVAFTADAKCSSSDSAKRIHSIFSSPAITDRKSIFVGHACVLTDMDQVAAILEEITKDKKVARATHPTIYAWVCRPSASDVVYRDCHDDGETAAGGRLAHLLDLLHLENVIVVVTRWYGGVHLGADRFKLINRAARDALEVAQIVSGPLNSKKSSSKCK